MKQINFIKEELYWYILYHRYQRYIYGSISLFSIILITMGYMTCSKFYQYRQVATKYESLLETHNTHESNHSLYDTLVHAKKRAYPGSIQELIHILDAARKYQIELVEWSTGDSTVLEVRAQKELDIHNFTSNLGQVRKGMHYEETVEKESGSSIYHGKITGTMEASSHQQKKTAHHQ